MKKIVSFFFTLVLIMFPFSVSSAESDISEMLDKIESLAKETISILKESKSHMYADLEKTRKEIKLSEEKISFIENSERILQFIDPGSLTAKLASAQREIAIYSSKEITRIMKQQQDIVWMINIMLQKVYPYEILPLILRELVNLKYFQASYLEPYLKKEIEFLELAKKSALKQRELRKKILSSFIFS